MPKTVKHSNGFSPAEILADMRENYNLLKDALTQERADRRTDRETFVREIEDLKKAHAAELSRVIEEKQKLTEKLHQYEEGEQFPEIGTDRETTSGSRDSTALSTTPSENEVQTWGRLLTGGTPFQRIKAAHYLAELARNHRVLHDETERLRQAEVKRLEEVAKAAQAEEDRKERESKAEAVPLPTA